MAKNRSKIRREKDLVIIADMYIRGITQSLIGKAVGVTQQTISADLKEIQKRWVAHTVRNLDEAKAEELAKIDRLENEYWKMFIASKETKVGRITDGRGKKRIIIQPRSERNPFGNITYLDGIRKCIMDRRALLGLDAVKELKIETIDWRTEAIALIREGKLTYLGLQEEIGESLAKELFVTAGIAITE